MVTYIVIVPNVAMPHSTARIGSITKELLLDLCADVVSFEDGDDEEAGQDLLLL